jgi:hypothetical protein
MSPARIPVALQERLGPMACEGLMELFAAAHERATASFEQRLREETASLRAEMKVGFADLKSDLLKWSFLFWTTQLAALAGIVSFLR